MVLLVFRPETKIKTEGPVNAKVRATMAMGAVATKQSPPKAEPVHHRSPPNSVVSTNRDDASLVMFV